MKYWVPAGASNAEAVRANTGLVQICKATVSCATHLVLNYHTIRVANKIRIAESIDGRVGGSRSGILVDLVQYVGLELYLWSSSHIVNSSNLKCYDSAYLSAEAAGSTDGEHTDNGKQEAGGWRKGWI